MKTSSLWIAAGIAFSLVAGTALADVTVEDFGTMPDGNAVQLFTVKNRPGASVQIMTYGAAIVTLRMPDRDGKFDDVVLGFDKLEGYLGNNPFFGATVGRVANRIGGARFTLDGVEYRIDSNNAGNTLHGGQRGFYAVLWTGQKIDDQTVEFAYLSKDGDQGFPGNLTTHVRFTLDAEKNEMKIDYSATTDKTTVVNLSNHAYYNLAGQGNGDILSHELMIDADKYTPVTARSIPTGQIVPVEGTPFDFRTAHPIGQRINDDIEQLRFGRGYDHNWVLDPKDGLRLAATVYEPTSGRTLDILTTEPGLQFYSGNGLDGRTGGKAGKSYPRRSGFCLETQHFPDSPNHPEFPSTVLKPGQEFHSTSVYRFSTRPASNP